jgi:hypothetical protein
MKKMKRHTTKDEELDIVIPKFVETKEAVDEYRKCLDVIARDNFID